MCGSNIQSPAEELKKVPVEYLYNRIVHPKPEIQSRIRQLRKCLELNQDAYRQQKRSLPYIVCGIFNPPYRRTDNFAYTEYFIVDIDHLSSRQLTVEGLRKTLSGDPRVLMCFVSPSEDGMKVMFKLMGRCYDSGQYSLFYKEFVSRFSRQHGLDQVIDRSTSDVARACFMSMDPDAYYNPQCELVDTRQYVDIDDPLSAMDLKQKHKQADKEAEKRKKEEERLDHVADPSKDIMARIKSKLNPKATKMQEQKPVYVPQLLNDIADDMKSYIEDTGLVVTEVRNIQYGKKLRITMGLKQAEVNVFYGKHGFTVVKSPRCGTNADLNDVVHDLVWSFLFTYE